MNTKIMHMKYGKGLIEDVKKCKGGFWVTVIFDKIGRKQLFSFIDPVKIKNRSENIF